MLELYKDTKILKGNLHILNDSTLSIDNEICSINEMSKLKRGKGDGLWCHDNWYNFSMCKYSNCLFWGYIFN